MKASKFTLTIELGNDAMRSSSDVARVLRNVSASLLEFPRHADDSKRIQDTNGNTVGEWSFE